MESKRSYPYQYLPPLYLPSPYHGRHNREGDDDDALSSPTTQHLHPREFTRKRRKRRTKRSATLSPSGRHHSVGHRLDHEQNYRPGGRDYLLAPSPTIARSASPSAGAVMRRPTLPDFNKAGRLRKTTSEPTDIFVDDFDQSKVDKINEILNSLNFTKYHIAPSPTAGAKSNMSSYISASALSPHDKEGYSTPKAFLQSMTSSSFDDKTYLGSYSGGSEEVVATDIEELKEAAQSIELLARRNRRKTADFALPLNSNSGSMASTSDRTSKSSGLPPIATSSLPRRSGITARLGGHPRGVMQFLPSVKSSEFLSKTAYENYMLTKNRQLPVQKMSEGQKSPRISTSETHINYGLARPSQSFRATTGRAEQLQELQPVDARATGPASAYRRKGSMPERFETYDDYAGELDSDNFLLTATAPGSYDDEDDLDKKYSAIVHERGGSKIARFATFSPSTNRTKQVLLARQLSQHASELDAEEQLKGVDSIAGVSRFGKLLKSFRSSRQNSVERKQPVSPTSSDSDSSSASGSDQLGPINFAKSWHGRMVPIHASDSDSSHRFQQADLLLWRKRSKGSLRRHEDIRTHVVKELFDTEGSYVENLQLMVHKYLRPLKRPELCSLIDPGLVEDIFFQIPEILGHHELFYAALKSRMDSWDSKQKIADIILNNFTKQSVLDCYTAFINNWKNAKRAIRTACQTKPAFAKYLVRCSRDHRSKLTLDALLIMPVQRIPRYELLIKELLKHTSVEHADHPLLMRAQKEIHSLATKINKVEQEAGLSEQMQQRLREIEAIVDGLDDLVSADRIFYRYDLVSVQSHGLKKERCLFLFSDQLIVTNVKRKTGSGLRKSSLMYANTLPLLKAIQTEVNQLEDDLRVLHKVSELTSLLKVAHEPVIKEIDKLKEDIRGNLHDKHHELTNNPNLTSIELLVTTEDGIEPFAVAFPSADKRVSWEKCFNDAKEALMLSLSKKPPPLFLKPLTLQKTRPGLHFGCGVPTTGKNEYGYPNVWISNSDGNVGQVCLLNLTPEPDLTSCNGIANSAILCICAVPVSRQSLKATRRLSLISGSLDTQEPGPDKATSLDLDSSSDSSDNDESTLLFPGGAPSVGSQVAASAPYPIANKTAIEISTVDEHLPQMWIGMDDGSILVFNFNDNIRMRKTTTKAQHSSSVNCLAHVDDRVFAAMGSGEIIFYERDKDGRWDMDMPRSLALKSPMPVCISSMLVVTNRLWCSGQNRIIIFHPNSLHLEHSFQVCGDTESSVACIANGGLGVWLAVQGSSVIKLYHVLSYECLLEINISPTVTKALAGCDDIIRQHKLARLRVTALLCCKDLLWIGTSAGIIVNLPLPHLSHKSGKILASPIPSVCFVGHSGQCRFLTSVDVLTGTLSRTGSHTGSLCGASDLSRRRMSLNIAALQQGKVYVISGGDGFEDLQEMVTDEADDAAGKEDSTNHLLVWEV